MQFASTDFPCQVRVTRNVDTVKIEVLPYRLNKQINIRKPGKKAVLPKGVKLPEVSPSLVDITFSAVSSDGFCADVSPLQSSKAASP